MLALSFPKFGHPAFAWIALTPVIVASARAHSLRGAFLTGLLAGVVYFAGTLYWLVETMTTFGGLHTGLAVVAAALLVAYLALFPAVFSVIFARCHRAYGFAAFLLAPCIWVTTELGRQYIWDGFPWALLGYSQVTVLPIAQSASIVGVYGVSWILALVGASAAAVVLERGRATWVLAATVTVLVVGASLWGDARVRSSVLTTQGTPVRVAVVQGNILQDDKNAAYTGNAEIADLIAQRYIDMTRQALAAGATFILWPESSTPFYFERDLVRGGVIRRLAQEANATLLIGSDQIEPVKATPAVEKPQDLYYNAAFLVQPDGQIGAVYRKMHLVPFGEYVPLKSLLFFVGPIVEAVSAFTPGKTSVLLPVDGHIVSTAICYEVIFPDLIRRFVQDGSELLTTITNDAWYGTSSAAFQHWEQASMRAIEEGRYLARAANTGISGFVDPYGRVMEKTGLFHQAMVVGDLRFITSRTIYSRCGDLIAWLSLALVAAALLGARRAVN
ncbi:MAG: apolipoprotein N-acyltransferase [Acidobacteria bacterium]|nr:apolipoprotein N-acyltransferase [Acidobacteriota bacterium]